MYGIIAVIIDVKKAVVIKDLASFSSLAPNNIYPFR